MRIFRMCLLMLVLVGCGTTQEALDRPRDGEPINGIIRDTDGEHAIVQYQRSQGSAREEVVRVSEFIDEGPACLQFWSLMSDPSSNRTITIVNPGVCPAYIR